MTQSKTGLARLSTQNNKVTVTVVAGAVVTVLSAFVEMGGELQGAIHTLVTAALVWLVRNREPWE